MIAGIVITHSALAEGLKAAVEMIAGPQENFESIGLQEGGSLETLSAEITAKAQSFRDQGMPVMVFVDLYGATPFNASCLSFAADDVHVLTGANLPMLLSFAMNRMAGDEVSALVENCLKDSREGIQNVSMVEMFGEVK